MRVSRRRLAALLAIVAVAAAAVVVAVRYAGSSPERRVADGGSGFSERRAGLGYLRRPGSTPDARPERGVERGVAQLFVVGFPGRSRFSPFFGQLRRRAWGGVLLTQENGTAIAAQARGVAQRAGNTPPLIVAAPGLPGMPRRGRASPATARAKAAAAARALRPQGISMVLAPAVDVGYTAGPYERYAFSADPIVVARSARAAVDGWRSGGIAPVAGSYPGTGAASANPAEAVATVGLSMDELRPRDISIFQGLNGRVPVIQMSAALYAAFDGVTPATLLPEAVAMLRRDFRGVVMSASLPATTLATGGSVAEAAVAALRAGCDLLLIPGDAQDQESAYRAVVRAVRRGDIPPARYRDAVARVSALKRAYRVR